MDHQPTSRWLYTHSDNGQPNMQLRLMLGRFERALFTRSRVIRACTGAPRGAPGQLHRLEASGLDFADAASLALPHASLRQQGGLANSPLGNWWSKAKYPNSHFADVERPEIESCGASAVARCQGPLGTAPYMCIISTADALLGTRPRK